MGPRGVIYQRRGVF